MGACCYREITPTIQPDSHLKPSESTLSSTTKTPQQTPRASVQKRKFHKRSASTIPVQNEKPEAKPDHKRTLTVLPEKSIPNLGEARLEVKMVPFRVPTKQLRKRFTEKYTVLKQVRTTVLGDFLLAKHAVTKAVSIVRRIARYGTRSNIEKSQETKLRVEIEHLSNIDHPNLLKYTTVLFDDKYLYAVSEPVIGTGILEISAFSNMQSEDVCASIAKQLLLTMNYCNLHGIVHGNLSPSNLFFLGIDSDEVLVKITGFGSYESQPFINSIDNSAMYQAPEAFGNQPTPKSDVWSCGILLHLLVCNNLPYSAASLNEYRASIGHYPPKYIEIQWEKVDSSLKSLIKDMLKRDVNTRLTVSQCLSHIWIENHCPSIEISPLELKSALTNMKLFISKQKIKIAILSFIAVRVLSPKQKQELIQVFRSIDFDHDGVLNRDDLTKAYAMTMPKDYAALLANRVLECVDLDANGSIEFSEFMLAASDHKCLLKQSRLRAVYDQFNVNEDGCISFEEFKSVVEFNESDEEWQKLMQEADSNGDGVLSFSEFSRLIKTVAGEMRDLNVVIKK